jgi:putative YhdH/YhfP family quinone oxidoreductase
MTEKFNAMVIGENSDKTFTRQIRQRGIDDLPDGDVLIRVCYSSLNYKDALSAIGNRGVTRQYPHTPGIDAAGIVEHSRSEHFSIGEEVIVTSYDLGMNTSGGFGQYIRVPAEWIVRLPEGLTLRQSMIFGTAGFTAGMSLQKLEERGITPDKGDILVTGATGGVGSMAVAILSRCGYSVVAVSGKETEKAFLTGLGAKDILSREQASDTSARPLLKPRWAGVVDTVGGNILETAIKSTQQDGVITCCGLVASPNLSLTVFPFILRAVSLVGIDSQNYPSGPRQQIWEKLAKEWRPQSLENMAKEISLEQLSEHIDLILAGRQTGRVIVNLKGTA